MARASSAYAASISRMSETCKHDCESASSERAARVASSRDVSRARSNRTTCVVDEADVASTIVHRTDKDVEASKEVASGDRKMSGRAAATEVALSAQL